MPITVIALTTVNPDAIEALNIYLETTRPLLEAAGAEIVQGFEISETIVGETLPERVMIVRYPSRAAVDQVFQSPAYQAIIPVRERAFLRYQIGISEA